MRVRDQSCSAVSKGNTPERCAGQRGQDGDFPELVNPIAVAEENGGLSEVGRVVP